MFRHLLSSPGDRTKGLSEWLFPFFPPERVNFTEDPCPPLTARSSPAPRRVCTSKGQVSNTSLGVKKEGRAAGGRRGSVCQGFSRLSRSSERAEVGADGAGCDSSSGGCAELGESSRLLHRKSGTWGKKAAFWDNAGKPHLHREPSRTGSLPSASGLCLRREVQRALDQQNREGLEHVSSLRGKWDLPSSCSIQTLVSISKSPLSPCCRGVGQTKPLVWGNSGFPSRGEGFLEEQI